MEAIESHTTDPTGSEPARTPRFASPLGGQRFTPRVARLYAALQSAMLRPQHNWRPASTLAALGESGTPLILRRARAFAQVLDEMPLEISADELIVGKCARDGVIVRSGLAEFASPEEKERARAEGRGIPSGLSHKVPDYPDLMARGLGGILSEIQEHVRLIGPQPETEGAGKKLLTLQAMAIEIEAVIRLAARCAALAEEQAQTADPIRAAELRRIAAACRWAPEHAPRNFHEALQSIWLVHFAFFSTGTSLSLGRFDQYAGPFLEQDLAAGRLTPDEAQELVDCLWIKFNDRAQIKRENFAARDVDRPWQAGLRWRTLVGSDNADAVNHFGQNLLLSGVRPDGADGTNRLTYLMLNSLEAFELTSPVVTVRLHAGSPPELVRRCAEVLRQGGGMPFIDNDDVLVPAYQKLGVPLEDARDYANSNCWETMIAGKSDQELIRGFNFLLMLEWALTRGVSRQSGRLEGIDTGDPRQFGSFADLLAAWKRQLDAYLEKSINYYGAHLSAGEINNSNHGRYAFNPLLSALIKDCVARETDVIQGGARYSIWHVMGEAVANAIDALAALKKLVYDEKKASMEQVLAALECNWSGYEDMRRQMVARAPKFANDDDYADAIGREMMEWFSQRTRLYAARYPGILFPCSVGTFSWYTSIGREVGASCDGRFAGEPVTPNFSPTFGMDLNGPTAAVRSYTAMALGDLAAGAPLDLRFSASSLRGEQGAARLAAFIQAFIALGGNILTVTVTDAETLRQAMADPEKYRGLRVRMGGWTAYFVALSREQQLLHIRKVEHGL